jgi:hypothetical protein
MRRLACVLGAVLMSSTGAGLITASAASAGLRHVRATAPCGVFDPALVVWDPGGVSIAGQLRDTCPRGYTAVFLHFDTRRPQIIHHPDVRSGAAAAGTQILALAYSPIAANQGPPSHIAVTVCSHYYGWHCGKTVHYL